MPNYNSQLQSNNVDLQTVLQTLQTKAAGSGGEQATPVISVNTSGLITATAGTKSSTHQLAFQPAKTITPGTASQIAVSSGYYTGGNITVAGDSNLVAKNIKSGVSIFGVSGTLVEGSGSSGSAAAWSENEDAMVTKTLSSYFNDRVNIIGDNAFQNYRSLTTVSFPAATTIGNNAFNSCVYLTAVNFPAVTTIGSSAFNYCIRLTDINFPMATTINYDAFNYCSYLTTVSFPSATTIGSHAFKNCRSLTTVSFPSATTIGSYAFSSCSRLTTVDFPSVSIINMYAFNNCSNLTVASFPAVTTIDECVFSKCYYLSQLYLLGSSLCTLLNSNAFTSTPYAGYSSYFYNTPSIYVPASLLTAYQRATNWTYFSSYFKTIATDDDIIPGEPISFTIDSSPAEAIGGMTWAEWVESDYNNGDYRCAGDDVKLMFYNVQLYGVNCKAYDVIIPNADYILFDESAYA